jgi:hypothetical protein
VPPSEPGLTDTIRKGHRSNKRGYGRPLAGDRSSGMHIHSIPLPSKSAIRNSDLAHHSAGSTFGQPQMYIVELVPSADAPLPLTSRVVSEGLAPTTRGPRWECLTGCAIISSLDVVKTGPAQQTAAVQFPVTVRQLTAQCVNKSGIERRTTEFSCSPSFRWVSLQGMSCETPVCTRVSGLPTGSTPRLPCYWVVFCATT